MDSYGVRTVFKNDNSSGSDDFTPGFRHSIRAQVEREKRWVTMSDIYQRRRVGAVKGKCDRIKVKNDQNNGMKGIEMGSSDEGKRAEVERILRLFREKCNELSRSRNCIRRVDLEALKVVKREGVIISERVPSIIGSVPGVDVGQKFRYRVEMMIVGLHNQIERGIDTKLHDGELVAVSVVAREGHSDMMNDANVLIYVGEGGGCKSPGLATDQELSGGNLALLKSKQGKCPVRVIRGFKIDVFDHVRKQMVKRSEFVYDGLYEVVSCERKRGLTGNVFFEFKMIRRPGQPAVSVRSDKGKCFKGL